MENPRVGIDMKRGENNVWSVKVPLPSPEIYTYNFVVDGVAVNDPQNVLVQRDGTRYLPMLLVPGERSENYYEAKQHGTVSPSSFPTSSTISALSAAAYANMTAWTRTSRASRRQDTNSIG